MKKKCKRKVKIVKKMRDDTIVRALKKFCADLLGTHFTIYTDHRTLECFQGQRDLSRRQAWWQEFLTEYNFKVVYVKGGNNTVADVLSRMLEEGEGTFRTTAAVLNVSADPKISEDIRVGYSSDTVTHRDGLLSFIGSNPFLPPVSNDIVTKIGRAHV